MPDINDLSDRERQILSLVATGASNKQIADKLFISTNTVKVHLRKIFAKIEVTSRTEAALFAVKAGVVESVALRSPDEMAVEANGSEGAHPLEGDLTFDFPKESLEGKNRWRILAVFAVVVVITLVLLVALKIVPPGSKAAASLIPPTSPPRWQVKASLPAPCQGLAVVSYEGQLYAIGGEGTSGVTGASERYNPDANSWTELASKPSPAADIGGAVIGGEIYVPGGRRVDGSPSSELDIYNPRLNTWRQGAKLPIPLSAYALATFEGKIYLFGGWDGREYVDSVFEYDPDADSWTERTSMGTARGFAGAAVAGGKIYVIGGFDGVQALSVNEVYLPERESSGENPWSMAAALPESRYGMGLVSVADILHVLGGEGQASNLDTTWEYFPQDDEWKKTDSQVSQTWSHFGLTLLETRLYVIGGLQGGVLSDQNLAYQAIYTVAIPIVR